MRLLFIGDSLIEFNDWSERFPMHEVYNSGVAGETVQGLLARFGSIRSRMPSPDAVFIMTGINNLAMEDRNFIPAYREVIRQVSGAWPDARVHVHSLLPVLFPWIADEDIKSANRELKRLAEEEKVIYTDIHREFLDDQGRPLRSHILDDGVHLSGRGYRTWEDCIERSLSSHQ